MGNLSALSVNMAAPQGKVGPGTWEQSSDGGFVDFMAVLMGRSSTPPTHVSVGRNVEPSTAMWTAAHKVAVAVADSKAVTTGIDKDVESVGPPQLVEGQEDLIRLIALIVGEEENDGFLCALRQFIIENPKIFKLFEAHSTYERITDFQNAYNLLYKLAWLIHRSDLPPELASLASLFMTITTAASLSVDPPPATEAPGAVDGVDTLPPAEPPEEGSVPAGEPVIADEPPTGEEPPPTEEPGRLGRPERGRGKGASRGREIPDGVDVTDFKVNRPHHSNHDHPRVRPAPPADPPAVPEQDVEAAAAQTDDDLIIWNLAEQSETGSEGFEAATAQTEPEPVTATAQKEPEPITAAAQAEPADMLNAEISVPQTGGSLQAAAPQQSAETAPIRQALASRIIDQIVSQAAKPQDVSVLQMELNPKFLGRIQLIIEATAEGMTARLRSDNGSVRSLLNENIAELRSSLREAGINMKDVEVTESRIGAQLSDRRFQQDGADKAEEQILKAGRLPAITAADEISGAEPATAAYAIGRVSGYADESRFDYRA